jgi:hypothetical protein
VAWVFSLIIVGHINNMDARPCLLTKAGVQVKWDIKHPGDALLLTGKNSPGHLWLSFPP